MKIASKYFLYARKSTDETKRQLLSLDAQARELRELAKREHLTVVEFLEESRTAKAPGRPTFNSMLERIERGEADGILVWDIDRLYRNPADEGRVRWMLQREIITSIRTASRDYGPLDAGLLIAVEGGRATDFIIHHKRDVARGVRQKLLSGAWPGQRPVGYIYDHDTHNIVPDPKFGKVVSTLYEEYSAGRHGLIWASERLAELGVVNSTGNHWSKSQMQRFFTNKLYIGIMVWNGEAFEGKFKPIVSPELFAKVGEVLKVRSKPHHVRNGHHFPFCGLFRCSCGCMITAQWAKGHGGRYRYYRCSSTCGEKFLREEALTFQLQEMLAPLSITSDEANHVRQLIAEDDASNRDFVEESLVKISERLSEIQGELNKLTRGYLKEVLDEDSYR
ncbi:MAG: recombinase family protein, partial [Opitutales bacterium]